MKKKLISMLGIFVLILSMTACGSTTTTSTTETDETVMTINGTAITLSEVNVMLFELKSIYENYYGVTDWTEEITEGQSVNDYAKEELKTQLTQLKLLEQYALDNELVIDEETQTTITDNATSVFETLTQEDIDAYGLTQEKLVSFFEMTTLASLAYDDMVADFVADEDMVQSQLEADATYQDIMADGIEHYNDKVTVRHILIKTVDDTYQPLSTEEIDAALTKIEGIREQLVAGADFEELAREYSEDPGVESNGGEYTFTKHDSYVPEFIETGFSLEVGEISEPVLSDYGYHLMKLEAKIPSTDEEIASVEETIQSLKDSYSASQASEYFYGLYTAMEEEATIEMNDEAWTALTFIADTASTEDVGALIEDATDTTSEDTTTEETAE